ncbi:ImmA/IrrE family metallo-endopeptidase [Pseudoblastomonas halimionae]|uniref:ImmA/IrrE family metallo-endopeptidase n=1 Tax=Alteriqipengyuania halimionae TaxID=1926630 RepID=A0A6I4U620_9SPHN|nr:ImmA/IrrE family metallo-endopeptidase [Alteriqipengyuania halimionae]MXP09717.1 ImmA/IrrE family metallo-endopeptidase [Alteriqipengyuania halimionae]
MSQVLADRLRDLRISRDSLVSKTALGRQRASEIIGGAKATVAELRQICAGLRLPIQIFTDSSKVENNSISPLFRSARDSSAEYDITVERIALFVKASLELLPERTSPPRWLGGFQNEQRTYPAADRSSKVARLLIDPANVDGPLADLGMKLNQLEGLIVSPIEHTRYEGVSLIAGNYCFIFVSPRFSGRMLFTLGHEFGHIVTDHVDGEFAKFERSRDIGSFGKSRKSEAFVDAFSSCLLLPDTGVGKFLAFLADQKIMVEGKITDREILYIARFFGVSFDVAGLRLEALGLIPEGLTFSLSRYLREEFGSPEKRADILNISPRQKVPIPRIPSLLSDAILRAVNTGETSIGWVSNSFGYSIGEIFAQQARAS